MICLEAFIRRNKIGQSKNNGIKTHV